MLKTNSRSSAPDLGHESSTPLLRRAQTACVSSMRAAAQLHNSSSAGVFCDDASSQTASRIVKNALASGAECSQHQKMAITTEMNSDASRNDSNQDDNSKNSKIPRLPPISGGQSFPTVGNGNGGKASSSRAFIGGTSDVNSPPCTFPSRTNGLPCFEVDDSPLSRGSRKSLPTDILRASTEGRALEQSYPPMRCPTMAIPSSVNGGFVAIGRGESMYNREEAPEEGEGNRKQNTVSSKRYSTLCALPKVTSSSLKRSPRANDKNQPLEKHVALDSVGAGSASIFGPFNVSRNNLDLLDEISCEKSDFSSHSSRRSSGNHDAAGQKKGDRVFTSIIVNTNNNNTTTSPSGRQGLQRESDGPTRASQCRPQVSHVRAEAKKDKDHDDADGDHEEVFFESGSDDSSSDSDSGSDASSVSPKGKGLLKPSGLPLKKGTLSVGRLSEFGFGKNRQLGGLSRIHNESTQSLTAMANDKFNCLFGQVVAEEGSPNNLNDSMSPIVRPLGGKGGLFAENFCDSSSGMFRPEHCASRRLSLEPCGGKKEIKKILNQPKKLELMAEMFEEARKAYDKKTCDFNMLELTEYPCAQLTPNLTSILTELILSQNQLKSLPRDMFGPMTKLKKLDVASNQLTTVPEELFLLPELEILLLDHNKITVLAFPSNSSSSSNSGSVVALNDSEPPSQDRALTPVPSGVSTSNPRNGRSSSIFQQGGNAKPSILPKIKHIGLAYNDLKKFPTEFLLYAGPYLEELVLSSNPDLFTNNQPSLADFERCRMGSKAPRLTLAVDNRPRFVNVLQREGWLNRLPWLHVEWEKIYPDKVLDFLFLGSLRTAQTPQVYQDLNIGFILTAGRNLEVVRDETIEDHLEIPVDDLPGENMIPLFNECFAFIDKAKKARRGVLIHCFAGLSRSVTITAAYLMKTMYPMTRDEALALIRQSRQAAMPNRGFMENLLVYEAQLRAEHGDGPPVSFPPKP